MNVATTMVFIEQHIVLIHRRIKAFCFWAQHFGAITNNPLEFPWLKPVNCYYFVISVLSSVSKFCNQPVWLAVITKDFIHNCLIWKKKCRLLYSCLVSHDWMSVWMSSVMFFFIVLIVTHSPVYLILSFFFSSREIFWHQTHVLPDST